ncbi:MAG: DUF5677 domain-containing protein [Bacillota bacterium]
MDKTFPLDVFASWLRKPYMAKGILGITEMLSGRTQEILDRREPDTLQKKIARYIFNRSTSSFDALRLLAEKGYYGESLVLLRLLLQNLISLAYINREPESRARLYDRQLDVIGRRFASGAREALAGFPGGVFVSLDEDLAESEGASDKKEPMWSDLKISRMAHECGMGWIYTIYQGYSHVTHGNAVAGYSSGEDPLRIPTGCPDCVSVGCLVLCLTLREAVKAYGFTTQEVLGGPYSFLNLTGQDTSQLDGIIKKILGAR